MRGETKAQIEREILFKKILKINNRFGRGRITEKEALDKIYIVRMNKKGKKDVGARITLPLCLAYKKVKLTIVEK